MVKRPATPRRLKVFRTAAGFDDAFVAAPSKKAALAAWGTSKDLFAIGAAELIEPEQAPKDVLEKPGEVILRSRGSLAEQLKAAGPRRSSRSQGVRAEPDSHPTVKRVAKPCPARRRPAPSRAALDAAEAELAEAIVQSEEAVAAIERQIEALEARKRAAQTDSRASLSKLQARVARQSDRYRSALESWAARE